MYPNPFEPFYETFPHTITNKTIVSMYGSQESSSQVRNYDQIASETHAKLGAELVALASHLKQTPQEVEIYIFETQRIAKALQSLFPDAEVIPHGSFQMQTALPDA